MSGRFWSRLSVGISNVRLTFRGWKQAAKHSSLPTTRLVLASRCGFTKSALQKAEALGLETMEYADGVPAQVGERIIGHGGELWIKGVVAIDCAMDLKIANRFGDRSMPVPNGAHSSIEGHPCDGGFDLLSALLDDCMEELRNRTVIATEGEVREALGVRR